MVAKTAILYFVALLQSDVLIRILIKFTIIHADIINIRVTIIKNKFCFLFYFFEKRRRQVLQNILRLMC